MSRLYTSAGIMQDEDIAIYTLLQGVDRASQQLCVPKASLLSKVSSLDCAGKFFTKLKQHIIETGISQGSQEAATRFGIPESLVVELLKMYLTETVFTNDLYPYNSYEKFVQVFIPPVYHSRTIGMQTSSPDSPTRQENATEERRANKQYTIKEKRRAIKECARHVSQAAASRTMNIPIVSIIRWRERIKKVAFKDEHYYTVYAGDKVSKRDSILNELDTWVYEWYLKNKQKLDAQQLDRELMAKAARIVTVDSSKPDISTQWLSGFKEHFNISSND